jgi:tetratricopeptide (TPR) repeat protein
MLPDWPPGSPKRDGIMTTFSRDPGTLSLTGIRAPDVRSLVGNLTADSFLGRFIAADLSLGAWRTHQVAAEFRAQLGLEGETPTPAAGNDAGSGRSRVGRLIDMDTRGDRITLEALQQATEVKAAVADRSPTVFCVFAPRYKLGWEPSDALFVRFFAQALQSTPHRLVLVSFEADDPVVLPDWNITWSSAPRLRTAQLNVAGQTVVGLIPGIVTPQVADALQLTNTASLLELSGSCLLVPPEWRSDFNNVAPERYDDLVANARQVCWLAAYASCHGSSHTVNTWSLWQHARKEFEAGGFGIALRLLTRAISLARTAAERNVFQLLAQSARIVSSQFKAAADCPDPGEEIPDELRGWLFHTKGWALTMLDRNAEAEPFLEKAQHLLRKMQGHEEYLYLLNISALNRLKLGDWEAALSIEREIRSVLDGVQAGFWQLKYVNALNLARLHKRIRKSETAECYYREAFATSLGVRSDADSIYMNVCQARLDEDRGSRANAYDAWLRAALYWVSSPVPEAIGRRVIGSILGPRKWPETNVTDCVSAALASHLTANATAAGMDREASLIAGADPALAPAFVRFDRLAEIGPPRPWYALRVAERWVLGCATTSSPAISSTSNRRLRSALFMLCAAAPQSPITGLPAIVVDDQLGHDMPRTESELLALCLRLGVRELVMDGEPLDLDDVARRRLEGMLRLRLGSAVHHVRFEPQGVLVAFKRYNEPQRLTGVAADVVASVRDAESDAEEACRAWPGDGASLMPLLRELERDRIIELYLPADVTRASLWHGR